MAGLSVQNSKNFSQDKYLEENILSSYSNKQYLELSFELCAEISISLKILLLSITNMAKITIIILVIMKTDI